MCARGQPVIAVIAVIVVIVVIVVSRVGRSLLAAYRLFAVVVHTGSGPNQGHYLSCISLTEKSSMWLCFDDERVTAIDEEMLASCYGACVPPVSSPLPCVALSLSRIVF